MYSVAAIGFIASRLASHTLRTATCKREGKDISASPDRAKRGMEIQRNLPDEICDFILEALPSDRDIDWPDAVDEMGSMHCRWSSDAADGTCTRSSPTMSAFSIPNTVADVTLQYFIPCSVAAFAGLRF